MNPNVDRVSARTVDQLIDLAGHAEITRHTPGEIHLKIKPRGIVLALNLDLLNLQASIRGILGSRADAASRTVVIHYDEKLLPKELWELLIKSHASPKVRELVRKALLAKLSD
jgi:hypothetical protein